MTTKHTPPFIDGDLSAGNRVTAAFVNDVNDAVYSVLGDGTNPATSGAAAFRNMSGGGLQGICEGRLTLTAGSSVVVADQNNKTTLFFSPYKGNRLALYNGSQWELSALSIEPGISIPAVTGMNDVFVFANPQPTLEIVAWTNVTTRRY